MGNKLKPKADDFMAGFCCALSTLARTHGEPTIAADIFLSAGFRLKDLKGVLEYDAAPLRKELKNKEAAK